MLTTLICSLSVAMLFVSLLLLILLAPVSLSPVSASAVSAPHTWPATGQAIRAPLADIPRNADLLKRQVTPTLRNRGGYTDARQGSLAQTPRKTVRPFSPAQRVRHTPCTLHTDQCRRAKSSSVFDTRAVL